MKIPFCPDLTEEQHAALDGYFNRKPKRRLFYGTSPDDCIEKFREINELRKSDPAKAAKRELAWFKIICYTRSNSSEQSSDSSE